MKEDTVYTVGLELQTYEIEGEGIRGFNKITVDMCEKIRERVK